MVASVASGDDRVLYSGSLSGVGRIDLSVGTPSVDSDLFGYADCTWRLEVDALYIDDEYEIDHSGALNCLQIDSLSIPEVTMVITPPIGEPIECPGSVSFSSFSLEKLPFVKRFPGNTVANISTSCGECTAFCSILSVNRGNSYAGTRQPCVEFVWSVDDTEWQYQPATGPLQRLEIVEVEGACFLKLTEVGIATLAGDLIAIDPDNCNLGMALTAIDDDDNYIRIGCNPCHCWEYKCDTCRCVCPTLCVSGSQDGDAVTPFELDWDEIEQRWGDAEFSVTLGKNAETGACEVTVTGYDPVEVDNLCSHNFGFLVSDYDGNFFSFSCKTCEGSCGAGTCLQYCSDVPAVLFAEISAADWDEALCPFLPTPCFETITIGLAQIFVGDVATGEFRWQGSGIIQCRNCNPTLTDPTDYIVSLDLGCDGLGSFSVRKRNPPPGHPDTMGGSWDIDFELPCGPGAVWDLEFEFDNASALQGCCDEAGFVVAVTE